MWSGAATNNLEWTTARNRAIQRLPRAKNRCLADWRCSCTCRRRIWRSVRSSQLSLPAWCRCASSLPVRDYFDKPEQAFPKFLPGASRPQLFLPVAAEHILLGTRENHQFAAGENAPISKNLSCMDENEIKILNSEIVPNIH
jgi:hypothetical protein